MPLTPFTTIGVPILLWILIALAASVAAPPRGEADWPQWRGPARDGVSEDAKWRPVGADENLWEQKVGLGYSTVSISDGRLYTKGYDAEGGKDVIWCFDAETGEELWAHTYEARIWNEMHGGGTLSTPSVDGEHVYALDREGRFHRLGSEEGDVQWDRDLVAELGVKPPRWGFAASPLVFADSIVLNLGTVVALDKKTGEVRWKSAKSYGDAYSTPADFALDGRAALAVFAGEGLAVLARDNGEELGFHAWKTKYDINAATPVVIDDRVFVSSGLDRGCSLVKFGGAEPEVVWEHKLMRNKMSGCVLWQKHLYGFDEDVLKCLDLDGKEKWRARGIGDGALVAAGGRLICTSSDGELVVADATPSGYRELSRKKVLDGGVFWTTPVIFAGRIYVRSSLGQLVCRDHRER